MQVVRRLEAQTYTEVAKLETNTMLRSLNAFQQAIMLVDVAARGWEILHANDALLQKLGARLAMPVSALPPGRPVHGLILLHKLTQVLLTHCCSRLPLRP